MVAELKEMNQMIRLQVGDMHVLMPPVREGAAQYRVKFTLYNQTGGNPDAPVQTRTDRTATEDLAATLIVL